MSQLLTVLAASFLGSAHCIGMCGGLAGALGASGRPLGPTLFRQLIYTSGRVFTYAFLGAVGGFGGLYLSQFKTSLVTAQQVFSVIAGVIMIYVGLSVLGLIPFQRRSAGPAGGLFAGLFAHFLNARGWFGYFAAGLATGFLPCGFVYAFLAMAVASADVTQGLLLMACFGLGTAPAMLLVGCGGTLLSHTGRMKAMRVAACLVIVMGAVTIYRAIPRASGQSCHEPVATIGPRSCKAAGQA